MTCFAIFCCYTIACPPQPWWYACVTDTAMKKSMVISVTSLHAVHGLSITVAAFMVKNSNSKLLALLNYTGLKCLKLHISQPIDVCTLMVFPN